MNDGQKLLDLFYRLHFALGAGVSDEHGYGDRGDDIAAGKRPSDADIYEGRHSEIYSTACNLYIKHKAPSGTAYVNVAWRLRGEWEVGVSCPARGQMTVEEARRHADDVVHAAKVAALCEEILARPIEFDLREGGRALNKAAEASWEVAGPDGNPELVLTDALERLNA